MKPEDTEQMKADREAAGDAPWKLVWWGNEKYPYPLSLLSNGDGHWIARDGTVSSEANARRIARVPTLEAEVLRLREALETITGVGFDAPMTWGGTAAEWERKRANIMQATARAALKGETP